MPGGGVHLAPQGQAAPPKPPGPRRQCRLPVPSAPWRRAPAPRAGGGRAALRFGWGGSGSRRRQAHEQGPAACKGMRWATLPCPAGARDAAGVRDRRCSPLRGKSASELARLILEASRERAEGRGALPIRYGRQARRGTGKGQRRTSSAGIRARPATAFPRRYNPAFRSFPTPCFPCHPAGRTAGSARTRSRDQSLENPFLGDGSRFPQRRRRQAPARGPAAVYSLHRPNRTETQSARPLLMGRACVNTEPKALASDTIGWRLFRRRGRRRSFAGTPQSPSRPRGRGRG